jgi:hypothetical protein
LERPWPPSSLSLLSLQCRGSSVQALRSEPLGAVWVHAALSHRGTARLLSSHSRGRGSGCTRWWSFSHSARKATAGLTATCPTQPGTASSCLAASVVTPARPVLPTEDPVLAKARAVVVTLLHCEESRGAVVHRQKERRVPTQGAQAPPCVVPAAAKKRVSKQASEKPLAFEPGPATAVARRAGADDPAGVAAEPTPQKWCPLYERSLHDVTACHHIGYLVKIRRERLTKRAAMGATHSCYECG